MHFKVTKERNDNEVKEKVKSKQKDDKRLWTGREVVAWNTRWTLLVVTASSDLDRHKDALLRGCNVIAMRNRAINHTIVGGVVTGLI